MSEINTISLQQVKACKQKPASTQLSAKSQTIKNPYKLQAFLDYGNSPGPWVKIGINSTVYTVGYLPTGRKR